MSRFTAGDPRCGLTSLALTALGLAAIAREG